MSSKERKREVRKMKQRMGRNWKTLDKPVIDKRRRSSLLNVGTNLALLPLLAGCHGPKRVVEDEAPEPTPIIKVEKTKCPLLEKYAKRNGVPQSELDKNGSDWPQFIYDMSVSCGPNLSKEEKQEFNAWQVK